MRAAVRALRAGVADRVAERDPAEVRRALRAIRHVSRDGVPDVVGAAGYRIVQEALTNVSRHAGRNAHAHVRLARRDGVVEIEVRDDGRGAPSPMRPRGGLTGMRERATALGGRFEAAGAPGGGFRVWASLPVVPR